jgi:methionine-rich copper-binding protein CopC
LEVEKMMPYLRPVLFAFVLLGTASLSWAHAHLDHAEPAVSSQVHDSPAQVKIWFTEKLEPALSKIQVFDASGKQVDKRDVQASKTDTALLSVSLPALQPGKYKVVWRVVSVDTHVTTGNFTFEVAR